MQVQRLVTESKVSCHQAGFGMCPGVKFHHGLIVHTHAVITRIISPKSKIKQNAAKNNASDHNMNCVGKQVI